MNAAHTPAPWAIVLKTEPLDVDGFIVEGGNDHEIRPVGDAKLGDEMADLRLIAAAPDLPAALRGVLRVADRATNEFDAARAAIAKAMGVQP